MFLANIFGPDVLIVVVIAVVVLFGAGQIPKLARSVGEASKEFKSAQKEAEETKAKEEAAKAASPVTPADDRITMSKADLDALLAEREAKARRESDRPPSN